MASRGSVIPLFVDQIQNDQPITITDPNMTRFLMSLDEAVHLVLYAFQHGKPGDIFVQKSPSCTMQTLVDAILAITGVDKHPINTIGTRHGEKLYECLLSREERVLSEDLGDYYRVPADLRDLNYDRYESSGEEKISHAEDYNSHNTRILNLAETIATLKDLNIFQELMQQYKP